MSEPIPVAFGRGSNRARHGQGGIARFVNAYVEDMGEEGKTSFSAFAINGWQLFATLSGGGALRRMAVVDNTLLAVAGRTLFSVNAAGTNVTAVGGIFADGMVTMAHNRKTPFKQVVIVSDGLWWLYEGGGLTQGSDADLPAPIYVVEIDGYFVFIIADGRFFIAGPNEGSEIDPLDFAEAEASSDGNVAAAVRGRTLIIMGERSTQFWDPNGSEDFPFSPTTSIDVGCYAAGSVANLLVTRGDAVVDTVIYAATDKHGSYCGIVALDGYTASIISTPEVDRLIRDEVSKANLMAMAWTEDARPFYAISGTDFTVTWDGKSKEWHHRKSPGSNRWNASCVAQLADQVLFGHRTESEIFKSLPTVFTEDGQPIVWQIQPPPIHIWPKSFKIDELQLDMITGVGLNSGNDDDDDPELVIDYSKDGGDSWAVQRRASLGQQAQRKTRVKERWFGRFDHNGVTFRFRCSAAVVKGLQQMALRTTALRT